MSISTGVVSTVQHQPKFGAVRKPTSEEVERLRELAKEAFKDDGWYVQRELNKENTIVSVREKLPFPLGILLGVKDLALLMAGIVRISADNHKKGKHDIFFHNIFPDRESAQRDLDATNAEGVNRPDSIRRNRPIGDTGTENLNWTKM